MIRATERQCINWKRNKFFTQKQKPQINVLCHHLSHVNVFGAISICGNNSLTITNKISKWTSINKEISFLKSITISEHSQKAWIVDHARKREPNSSASTDYANKSSFFFFLKINH